MALAFGLALALLMTPLKAADQANREKRGTERREG